jgi:glycosyltransferase involved in cell wall biosynthesis
MTVFSIIIPAYNEKKHIENVLKGVRAFRADDFRVEIILVDNGSSDGTSELAKNYCDRIEVLPDLTIASLRNYGVNKAKGEYIGFIDADCVPCAEWAKQAKEFLDAHPEVGIVGSYYAAGNNPTWVEQKWQDMRKNLIGPVRFLPAGNMAVRKAEFLSMGGFPENLITCEDYALCQKYRDSGSAVWNDPGIVSVHYGNSKTLRDIFRREKWYGQNMVLGGISPVFIAANAYLAGFIALIIALITSVVFRSKYAIPLFSGGGVLFIVPTILYALKAARGSGRLGNIGFYAAIYAAYILGRMNSLFYVYSGRQKPRKR